MLVNCHCGHKATTYVLDSAPGASAVGLVGEVDEVAEFGDEALSAVAVPTIQ